MTIDLLVLAGGRERIFSAAFEQAGDIQGAPQAIAALTSQYAEGTLTGELMAEMVIIRDLHVLMNGDRPHGPSDATDMWDEGFEGEVLPAFEKYAARAGVPQKWIIDHLAGAVRDDPEVIHSLCRETAQAMVAAVLIGKGTVNKRLSALGITMGDIEAAWKLQSAGAGVDTPPQRHDFLSYADTNAPARTYAPEDVTAAAKVHVPASLPPLPAPAPMATLGNGKAEEPKRRNRNQNATFILPSIVFTTLRGVGATDKEVAEKIKIPRSSYTRIASGQAEEIGLTDAQATALVEYVALKQRELSSVVSTLELYGLAAS